MEDFVLEKPKGKIVLNKEEVIDLVDNEHLSKYFPEDSKLYMVTPQEVDQLLKALDHMLELTDRLIKARSADLDFIYSLK